MGGQKLYNFDDVIMAKFALALGLPVRIFIIRVIINQNNSAIKEDFDNPFFATELLNKHISQLKGLGILKIKTEKRRSTYSIDKAFFGDMSKKFNLLFKSLESKNENEKPATQTEDHPELKFSDYLKAQRLAFHFTQQEFADRLNMDKTIINEVETGKQIFPPEKLEELSHIIYQDPAFIKNIYTISYPEK